jgi:hypothetical protein
MLGTEGVGRESHRRREGLVDDRRPGSARIGRWRNRGRKGMVSLRCGLACLGLENW